MHGLQWPEGEVTVQLGCQEDRDRKEGDGCQEDGDRKEGDGYQQDGDRKEGELVARDHGVSLLGTLRTHAYRDFVWAVKTDCYRIFSGDETGKIVIHDFLMLDD